MQQYILYNYDLSCLMSTTVYNSYYEASKITECYKNVIVLTVEVPDDNFYRY